MRTFTITEEHMKLARRMYVGWQNCEFGAPEIDPKRPYGNSDVHGDIAEIIGLKPSDDEDEPFTPNEVDVMDRLHKGMQLVLQIGLSTGSFEAGTYEGEEYGNKWRKV